MTIYHLFTAVSCLVGAGVFSWLWTYDSTRIRLVIHDSGVYNDVEMTTTSDFNGLI